MNRPLVLLSSLLLAGALAGAQDSLGSGAKPDNQDPNARAGSQASTTQNSTVLRGCLSGSAGNFTLTDQNGMQYKLMGEETALQTKTGHEIEITGTEIQPAGTSSGQESMAQMAHGYQVSDVRDVSGSCRLGRNGNSQPMGGSQPDKGGDSTKPQLMAMLQQPAPLPPKSAADQSQQPTQTNPPAGDQSAARPSQTNADQPSANNGATSGDAQSGQAAGQNMNNQGTANSGAASSNSTTPPANADSNTNDQNKPLYERQATDVPWASHTSNGNSGATTSPNPQ